MDKIKLTAKGNRIDILDSYRFIAILSVMLYHYYSRWTPPLNKVSLYPYGSSYDHFSFGWLGVQFFFIISGFVIAFTLTRTEGFIEFWKKRLIRLLPSMFICSLVTFSVFYFIDPTKIFPDSHSITNFLYSITLLSPDLLNQFPYFSIKGAYLNGSYWSLWPEIQFYIVASCIYFINKKNFVRNIALFTIIICIVNYLTLRVFYNVLSSNKLHINITKSFIENYVFWIGGIFNYLTYSLYFIIGVLFFQMYTKQKLLMTSIFLLIVILLLIFLEQGFHWYFLPVHSVIIMVLIFLCFIFYSKQMSFITLKPLTNIGIASYSLYLIHEHIGVLLINKYANLFGKLDFIFPILVILLMICFSLFSFKYIEKPIGSYLKKKLVK